MAHLKKTVLVVFSGINLILVAVCIVTVQPLLLWGFTKPAGNLIIDGVKVYADWNIELLEKSA